MLLLLIDDDHDDDDVAMSMIMTRMVVLVAVTFVLCWTPFYLASIVKQLQTDSFLCRSQFLFTALTTQWAGDKIAPFQKSLHSADNLLVTRPPSHLTLSFVVTSFEFMEKLYGS